MIHKNRAYDLARTACRLEWGWRGARLAAERGDVLAVVDVLSFSTTAVTASATTSSTRVNPRSLTGDVGREFEVSGTLDHLHGFDDLS